MFSEIIPAFRRTYRNVCVGCLKGPRLNLFGKINRGEGCASFIEKEQLSAHRLKFREVLWQCIVVDMHTDSCVLQPCLVGFCESFER